MRVSQRAAYAVRACRGLFALHLPVSARVRRDFRFDLVSGLLGGIFSGSAVGYIYVVARTIGVSQFGISVLMAMGAISGLLCLPTSLVVKPEHGRFFLFATLALSRGMLLLIVILNGPGPYMIVISIFFLAGGVSGPFYAEIMQHIYPREFRGQLMSLVRIGSGTVMTCTSLLTAWVFGKGYLSYEALFVIGGMLGLASLLSFFMVTPVRPPPRPRHTLRDVTSIMLRNRRFAFYELGVFTMASGAIIAGTIYPLVIVDKLHAGYGSYGVLTVMGSLGYLISWFGWGKVVDSAGPAFTMLIVGVCILALPLAMLVAPSVFWLAPALFINGVSSGGFEIGPIAAVIHYARGEPDEVPQYMAVHSILIGVRGTLFPFVAILILAGHHYGLASCTALAVTAVGTYLLWRLHLEDRADVGQDSSILMPARSAAASKDVD